MKGLGFIPDIPDIRDFTFSSPLADNKAILPATFSLRDHPDMPVIYDQGSIGSCVAHAVGTLCDFEYGKDWGYDPSRLFLYYVTRSLEGTVDSDAGATIRNGIKAANEFGVPKELLWPYVENKFAERPRVDVFEAALNFQALQYRRVRQKLVDIKACLFEENLIAFGFAVYNNLYDLTKDNPVLEFPDTDMELQGGHAVVITSYDDTNRLFTIKNSWSTDFADEGYFYMPYEFVLNPSFCMDFWTISLVEK